jgi:hypothetical protein
VLMSLSRQDPSHGHRARPRFVHPQVRRPLARGIDELGLDRRHSSWADRDMIDAAMLNRKIVHDRPAELATCEQHSCERLRRLIITEYVLIKEIPTSTQSGADGTQPRLKVGRHRRSQR